MLRRRPIFPILAVMLVLSACTPTEQATGPTIATTSTPTVGTTGPPLSTSTTPTPTSQPAPSSETFVGAYSFQPGVIDLDWVRQPTRIEAVVGVPAGEGPFPVAIFLHGLGYSCISTHDAAPGPYRTIEWNPPCSAEDTEYLRAAFAGSEIVSAAARRGIVGMAIDINAAYFWWGGEVSESAVITQLLETHLSILEGIAGGTILLTGLDHSFSIDLGQLGMVGHSRGGSYVEALVGTDDPSFVAIEQAPSAVALLGTAGTVGDPARAVPTLNVRAECDADVGPTVGLDFVEMMKDLGAGLVVDALVTGASHWTMTSYPLAEPAPECAPGRSEPDGDAATVANLVASFLAAVLHDETPILVADEQRVRLAILAGSVETAHPDGASATEPIQLHITEIGEARLDPILPGDRFLTSDQLEDF